jgi:hypothetical protein
MFLERCITAAVFKDRWWLLFHHLIWLLFVWVLKEDPEFDFNGMLSGIIGSLKK